MAFRALAYGQDLNADEYEYLFHIFLALHAGMAARQCGCADCFPWLPRRPWPVHSCLYPFHRQQSCEACAGQALLAALTLWPSAPPLVVADLSINATPPFYS